MYLMASNQMCHLVGSCLWAFSHIFNCQYSMPVIHSYNKLEWNIRQCPQRDCTIPPSLYHLFSSCPWQGTFRSPSPNSLSQSALPFPCPELSVLFCNAEGRGVVQGTPLEATKGRSPEEILLFFWILSKLPPSALALHLPYVSTSRVSLIVKNCQRKILFDFCQILN